MLYEDLIPISTDSFGGYCPAIPPADLPPGAAVYAQNCEFPMASVRSRGGLRNVFAVSVGAASVNGLKSYITPTLARRLLIYTDQGSFDVENPQGTLNILANRPYTNLFKQSITLFGREYEAYFNAMGGFDIPRQFDDTNWDRVSQGGPGLAPSAVDESGSTANPGLSHSGALNVIAGPNGTKQVGYLVTVSVVSLPAGILAGDSVVLAGVVVAAYNGIWTIVSVDTIHNTFQYVNTVSGLANSGGGTADTGLTIVAVNPTPLGLFVGGPNVTIAGAVAGYNGTWPVRGISGGVNFLIMVATAGLGASGAGTMVVAGNVAAGLHQISVAFVTRQGFITQPPAGNSWTASGNKRVICSNIPTGPPNIIARLLLFTPVITAPAVTGSYYSLPTGSQQIPTSTMLIADNTTTTVTVDFTDAVLISGFQANYLFTQVELGEPAFVIGYNSRLFWIGERNRLSNFVNMGAEGGVVDPIAFPAPLGWTPDATVFAGIFGNDLSEWETNTSGGSNLAPSGGFGFGISGDGVTAVRGKITQSAAKDYLGVPRIRTNTSYGVRVRVARSLGLNAGTFHINLQSSSAGINTVGLAVPVLATTLGFQEFTANLTDVPLTTIPADLLLQVFADGTPGPINQGFFFDSMEIFPTNVPVNFSTARVSHAFNPESYDGVTGQVQVRPGDGQQLKAGFTLRSNLYFAKDHYLCYVTDDGINEPSAWAVNEVSSTIGICGPNAVASTEEWACFAERSGVYLCWGADPVKISQEIDTDAANLGRPAWNLVNWNAAHTIWVRIDQARKMILIGAPINGATTPNIIFGLDYKWLNSPEEIASSDSVTYSSFTGKMLSHGRGRRWFYWNISANSMCFAERADGTAQPFFGNGVANGKIYQQLAPNLQSSDDGVAVNFRWRGYGCPSAEQEQALQIGAGRKLMGYLKFRATGVGHLLLSAITAQRTTTLRPYVLSASPTGDGERPININGERFYIEVGTNAVNDWALVEKLIPYIRKSATMITRGTTV